jgi:predicted O-linked N-acetylglucosamine transferase (SPINDLY family)
MSRTKSTPPTTSQRLPSYDDGVGGKLPSPMCTRDNKVAFGLLATASALTSAASAWTLHRHGRFMSSSPPVRRSSLRAAIETTRRENAYDNPPSKLDELLTRAQHFLAEKNADGAFATLAEAYGLDPTSSRISPMFEACLGIKVEVSEERFYKWKNTASDSVGGNSAYSETELTNLFQDRMGISSLCIDKEQYDEAGIQLRKAIEESTFWLKYSMQLGQHEVGESDNPTILDLSSTQFQHWQPQIDRAQYLLYRTNAACCKWDTYFQDGDRLRLSLNHKTLSSGHVVRLLHPFDALKFPCISLELASDIASSYAARALESVGVGVNTIKKDATTRRTVTVRSTATNSTNETQQKKIRIGYISPDFTSRHPLAFLMQHVFRYHDKSKFTINIYSVSSSEQDDGVEVKAIRESSDSFTYLSPSSMPPIELYQRLMQDELDVLVDLCGYAGTSVVAEIMASRCILQQKAEGNGGHQQRFPVHVSYMGFPASVGSSKVWDYSVFDQCVVPPEDELGIRKHYSEALVFMPHCYFVNSHKTVVGGKEDGIVLSSDDERVSLRQKYGIDPAAFVYCCHSRPDKIDPSTFRSWLRAIRRVISEQSGTDAPSPVLWLLRSGEEMEHNLRQLVVCEFGEDMQDCLVFAEVADRREHLKRLGCADLFLDTPAYNAHTLGCDALYVGVPMVSLLRNYDGNSKVNLEFADAVASSGSDDNNRAVSTDKLASRVGASLLISASCEALIVSDMNEYEDMMVKCVSEKGWFNGVQERLSSSVDSSPLFDTERWVQNLEASLQTIVSLDTSDILPDIVVLDEEP